MKRTLTVARQNLAAILLVIIGVSSYGCGDSASLPDGPEVRLASLQINPGTLQPAFSPETTGYTVKVSATTTAVTVTATPEDSATTVTIAGSATKSLSVTLGTPGSSKDITIALKSQNGSQSTYTVTVNKAELSSNTDLSALTVTPGKLTPDFNPNTLTYTVDVESTVSSVTVTATKADPNALFSGSITDPGAGQVTGQAIIKLGGPGSATPVTITVIAQNGNADTYRVTVNQAAPASDNKLSGLTVSPGTLKPAFASDKLKYDVNLAAADSTVTISATKSDPNAVMAALGSVIAPAGTATGGVSIEPGLGTSTDVAITVIAQDQISIKTYSLKVNRPSK